MLFSNQRRHDVILPALDINGQSSNMGFLIKWICHNLMKDPRKEIFVLNDSM